MLPSHVAAGPLEAVQLEGFVLGLLISGLMKHKIGLMNSGIFPCLTIRWKKIKEEKLLSTCWFSYHTLPRSEQRDSTADFISREVDWRMGRWRAMSIVCLWNGHILVPWTHLSSSRTEYVSRPSSKVLMFIMLQHEQKWWKQKLKTWFLKHEQKQIHLI